MNGTLQSGVLPDEPVINDNRMCLDLLSLILVTVRGETGSGVCLEEEDVPLVAFAALSPRACKHIASV